jgi:ABC-type Co2+ transport system permease subunit
MTALMLRDLHVSWSWVVIIGNALAGIWALAAHKVTQLRSRALWWFTGLVQFAVFVQVALGVALVNKHKIGFPQFHAFYGFVAIIAIAIIYSYRAQLKSRVYLLYGFGGLFLMGLGIRAMLVGRG